MHFSRLVFALWGIGWYYDSQDVICVWYSCTWGVNISFLMARVLDDTVYARMRKKNNWSESLFYIGHVVFHIFPLVCAILFYERPNLFHGIVAVALHACWYLTHNLDDLYVPMKRQEWQTLMLMAFTMEIVCCVSE